jgi:cullin 3
MIDTDKADDLARLYRLFVMVPDGLPSLKKALKQSINGRGQDINRASAGHEPSDDFVDVEGMEEEAVKGKARTKANTAAQTLALALKWVQDVLDLKDKFDQVWKRSMQCDRDLESGINEVRFFTTFVLHH